ncbi:DUF998 domain-containing protein [Micromonospora sp. URMC 105]|uniref:DUF998 domain-containing protein n=1 Tax=Micromonospora sp. URMC 105 TaxID=3423413 RepID=UPI003F1B67CF
MPATRKHALVALGALALAALLTVIGHLEVNDDLDPWSLTVSDFAVADRGGVIDAAMVVLAAATAVLLPALRRLAQRPTGGGTAGRGARLLLAAWAVGLLAAAIVPTNEPGLPMETAAHLHRYASVAAFLALPTGGWLLARHLPGATAGRWVRGLALASLALAAAMAWSAHPGDRMLIGLAERLLILAEVGLLAVVAAALTRSGAAPAPLRGPSAVDLNRTSAPSVGG